MNERIKNFYDQVGLDFENFQRVTVTKGDMEKFAELIVEECLDILDDEDDGSHDGRSVRIAAIRIKKLFGVEE